MTKFKANCLNCRKVYWSEGKAEEFGQCSDCNVKENWRLLHLETPYEKRKVRSVYPRHLGAEKIEEIFEYYRRNLRQLKRSDALKEILKVFNVRLSFEEFSAILTKFYNRA